MPRINHPIEHEELMAYLDGELSPDRAGAAAGHLERCRECQGLAADLQGVSRRLMEWQVEPVDFEISKSEALAQPARKPRVTRWVWSFAAAAILVVVFSMALPKIRLQRNVMQTYERAQNRRLDSSAATNFSMRMIARTAQLSISTQEFDQARAALEEILKRHNGYLGQLSVNNPSGSGRTLDATLRIPTDHRDAAIAEIKKLGRVESESQTGEEVTSQYVDLEARLSNARNTEQRLSDMLRQRTGKLSDVLAVEQEISRVRGQIEQMEAEKKTLTTRVEFLSLDVRLTEDYRAQLQIAPDSTLGQFRNAAIAGYKRTVESVVSVALFLLAYGPSVLIWIALLFFPARLAWRRLRRS